MNSNYELIFEKYVETLKSKALLFKHKKTGARVFCLSNDDDNKVFYIGFRTPPEDNTGVAHIIEHTVLCGSDKYPLKDPFIELAKGSLNTFLNAMTYPDKTVYPVASRNDKDFANLMSVYMDAVFHPNIYKYEEIFKQEGWSYMLENADEPLKYNGVVYNEMKGAFSSPESVLERKILNSLFPDTCYGFESGGDPKYIPDLTYKAFLDFHAKYYHPSNSYIYLYGNMDIEERLKWMDEEYLSAYDRLEIDSEIKQQPGFENMHTVKTEYSVSDDEEEKENTYLAYNIVCGDNLDEKKTLAMQMLLYALVDTQGAPIRQRLLDEGIGKDILPSYENGILQPYFSIVSKNADENRAEDFIRIINEEFEKAANGALNKRSLAASLNSMKFKYKEADFGGYPKGLIYGLNVLDSWIYDENKPLLYIDADETYEYMAKNLESGYFEEIIKEYLLDNSHASLVILNPRKQLTAINEEQLAKKLEEYKKSLSDEEVKKLIEDTKNLKAFQEEESTKEQLETIPLLERSDIERDTEGFSNIKEEYLGIPIVRHDYYTNGIAYVDFMFNANCVTAEELPYLGLLKSVISFVDTQNYTYSELNDEINIETGGLLLAGTILSDRKDKDKQAIYTTLGLRTLHENMKKSIRLCEEVLFKGKYDDEKRLKEIIAELKSKLQMTMNSAGHVVASSRAESYYLKGAKIRELFDGVDFYRFAEKADKDFENEKDKIIAGIKTLIGKLFRKEGLLISYTGDEKGYELLKAELSEFAKALETYENEAGTKIKPCEKYFDFDGSGLELKQMNEAFKTPAEIQYVARAGLYLENPGEYTGAMAVFRTIMNYEYMWFNIRVQGGAYGCMCKAAANGSCSFVTYRDPNLRRSSEVFEKIPEYLESFDVDEREMTKFVIGTMSGVDTPLTPFSKGVRDMNALLTNTSHEDLLKARHEIIDCSKEDIKKIAPLIRKAMGEGNICVVGNESKIEEDKDMFMNITNLFE